MKVDAEKLGARMRARKEELLSEMGVAEATATDWGFGAPSRRVAAVPQRPAARRNCPAL